MRLPSLEGRRRRMHAGSGWTERGGGLAAHTLYEQRDINDAKALFEDVRDQDDPAMVQLATQLISRQNDPVDLEDSYETRLREMSDAKLIGQRL